MNVATDAALRPIVDIADELGLDSDQVEPHGARFAVCIERGEPTR